MSNETSAGDLTRIGSSIIRVNAPTAAVPEPSALGLLGLGEAADEIVATLD